MSIPVPLSIEAVRRLDPDLAEKIAGDFRRTLLAAEALAWARDRIPALRQAPTTSAVLSLVVDEATAVSDAPQAWAVGWEGDPDGRVVFEALVGAEGDEVPTPDQLPTTVLGEVARTGRPQWSDDAGIDAHLASSRSVQGLALRSVGCVPLGRRGALYLSDPELPGRFDAQVRARITALCALAGTFLVPVSRSVRRAEREVPAVPGMVGTSAAMSEVYATVRAFAPMPWPVLVLGETGTGKELVARAVHALSSRADGPFVAVNCGAIPDELAESALFGHEKGAFTGADRQRIGWVERARGGTLFLDEVGELSPRAQVKLLRLLQEGVFERVGGTEERRFDGRIVAATLRAIDDAGARESFREDLFHRLSACIVRVPPLRDRRRDIPSLATHLLAVAAEELPGSPSLRIDERALDDLTRRAWPGNVRELGNAIRGAIASCLAAGRTVLHADDFRDAPTDAPLATFDLQEATEQLQRRMVREALAACEGNRTRAAERLGVSRQWLHRLIARWEKP